MNVKNLALAAAFCASGLAGCGPKGGSSEGAVTVDFNGCAEKSIAELGDGFHSSKRYVALHADTPELMIGEVGKVVLHGDRIFVSEKGYGPRSDHKLVVHAADGRALGQVGHKGRGPGEFLQIGDFDVDAAGRVHIYGSTFGVKKIFVYGADGKFLGEKQLPFSADLFRCVADADLNVLSTAGEYDMGRIDTNNVLGDGSLAATPEGFVSQQASDETMFLLNGYGEIVRTWLLDLGPGAVPVEVRGDLGPLFDSGKIAEHNWFGEFVAPWGRYIFGTMEGRVRFRSFIYDTEAGVNYVQDVQEGGLGDFGAAVTISDGRLVTFFQSDGESYPTDLPASLRAGYASGDPLLCLYTLK